MLSAVTQALYYSFAKATSDQMPFLSMFKVNMVREFNPGADKIPKLMLTILNGGKDLQSKVKFSKFYIIFNKFMGFLMKMLYIFEILFIVV